MGIFFVILFCTILSTSCSPNASTPSALPENTATPTPVFTPEPIQTVTPVSIPTLDITKIGALAAFNAITIVSSADNNTDIWAVGDEGLIVRYQHSQGHFSFVESPERRNLADVDFVSPDDGWIVGAGGLILHWDGHDWEVSNPYTSGGFYSHEFTSVAFSEANNGWAAGCVNSEGGEQILIFHWDGMTWSQVSLPEELVFWVCIHDIAALSPDDVWMVGTGRDGVEHGVALHWDGTQWESFVEGDSFTIHSISALSSDDVWAIANRSDIAYTYSVWHWDGNEWIEQATLESANIIYARKADDVYAVGDIIWHWDGSNWKNISLNSNLPLDTDIVGLVEIPSNSGDMWLLDSSGTMYGFGLYWIDHGIFK